MSGATSVLDINQATLSGSNDVIVIRQSDGSLKSTPFHVRFGKTKLLHSRGGVVKIAVNDEPKDLEMILGAAGEACFVRPVADEFEDEDASPELSTGQEEVPLLQVPPEKPSAPPSQRQRSPSPRPQKNATPNPTPRSASSKRTEGTNAPQYLADENTPARPGGMSDIVVEFSLCGHLLNGNAGDQALNLHNFQENKITWSQLDENPSLWYHKSLVARFQSIDVYYPGKVALPLLASLHAYNKTLTPEAVWRLMHMDVKADQLPERGTYENWVAGSSGPSSPVNLSDEAFKVHKSLRPTSAELASLGLKMGANPVTYTVSSTLQGEKTVKGTIYLWGPNEKIVISDVDGTITRSDLLGQLAPIVGRDWSHAGVAELFTLIRRNGYQMLYMTARAIGQADLTRDYLFGLKQGEQFSLPDGPLLCSPDRLFDSFKREVILRQPHVFKGAVLRDIRNLFPPHYNPFYCGFGNRDTDHRAYVHYGIPESRVYIIDKTGNIHHINKVYAKTYNSMAEISEEMFPPFMDKDDFVVEDDKVRERKLLSYKPAANAIELEDKVVQPSRWCCAAK